jgi:hypothetical protein
VKVIAVREATEEEREAGSLAEGLLSLGLSPPSDRLH